MMGPILYAIGAILLLFAMTWKTEEHERSDRRCVLIASALFAIAGGVA